jgi:5,10-methenyltetrahydromethanopterin hydrogenase
MRDMILNAIKTKMIGQMNAHIANAEVMLNNPVGARDRATVIDTIEKEMAALQHLNGKLNVLTKYFERSNENAIENQQQEKAKSKSK